MLAGPLALIVRRRHPVLCLAVAAGSTVIFIGLGYSYGPVFLSPIVAFHTAVVSGHRRAAWSIWGLAYVFLVVYTSWLAPVRTAGWLHDLTVGALMGLVLVVAEFSRARRERQAERERVEEEELRRQASEERLTMAQELHDVLAHNISLIHVQASTALHLIDDHPEQARTALTTIKQASKDVLTEMRSVLNVLRDGAPAPPPPGWAGSTSSSSAAGCRSPRRSSARPGRCLPASTGPGTASCRRPSPTSPGTPPARRSRSCSATAPAR